MIFYDNKIIVKVIPVIIIIILKFLKIMFFENIY